MIFLVRFYQTVGATVVANPGRGVVLSPLSIVYSDTLFYIEHFSVLCPARAEGSD